MRSFKLDLLALSVCKFTFWFDGMAALREQLSGSQTDATVDGMIVSTGVVCNRMFTVLFLAYCSKSHEMS